MKIYTTDIGIVIIEKQLHVIFARPKTVRLKGVVGLSRTSHGNNSPDCSAKLGVLFR